MARGGMDKPLPIEDMLSIFYVEFDNKKGPMLVEEYPQWVIGQVVAKSEHGQSASLPKDVHHDGVSIPDEDISHEHATQNTLFDGISEYMITDEELCGNLITVPAGDYRVVTYPLSVQDEAYDRSQFSFSFGMVFRGDASPGPFKPLLRKLGNSMLVLELETKYLSEPSTKRCVGKLIEQVFLDLRSSGGECMIPVNVANTIALKLIPRHTDPAMVFDYQVPVRTVNFDEYLTKEWDLTIQYIIPHIDGSKYVKRIAQDSNVDTTLVRRGLRQLLYYGCVQMVDIFQYSNRYRCTERYLEFARNTMWQRECCKYVGRGNPLPFEYCSKLLQLYGFFHPHISLGDFCLVHDTASLNIDDLKFVTFGVAYGLIRRVQLYPVLPLHLRAPRVAAVERQKG